MKMPKVVHPGSNVPVHYDEPVVSELPELEPEEIEDGDTGPSTDPSGGSRETADTEVHDEPDGGGESPEAESEDGDGVGADETA
jgi:hypothetical protein